MGKKRLVEWLVRFKDAAVNAKDAESGYTALHRSVYHGQIHVTRYLLSAQAGPANAAITDHEGLTPIDLMIKDRYVQQAFL